MFNVGDTCQIDIFPCQKDEQSDDEEEDEPIRDEIRLFRKQTWLRLKRQEVSNEYEQKLRRLIQDHEEAQEQITNDVEKAHVQDLYVCDSDRNPSSSISLTMIRTMGSRQYEIE